eukprot:GHVN01064073.1.p1 GENE.GHVN01064073.1~~GHVN01064073.1.p1  ORF type:complete len:828 (+),score=200.05 GHVN01064073.1:241-2724(+)
MYDVGDDDKGAAATGSGRPNPLTLHSPTAKTTTTDTVMGDTNVHVVTGGAPEDVDAHSNAHLPSGFDDDDEDHNSHHLNDADSGGDDDDHDPVVREIEVYINRCADISPYLLQYPLRPIYRPYGDQGQLKKIEYRRTQKSFRFTYGLNTEGDNFDENRRGSYSRDTGTDGALDMGDNEDDTCVNHVLKSEPTVSSHCAYGLAQLKGDRLYICPIEQIIQFRPSFTHVDEAHRKAESKGAAHVEASVNQVTALDGAGGGGEGKGGSISATSSAVGGVGTGTPSSTSGTGTTSVGVRSESGLAAAKQKLIEGRQRIPHARLRDLEMEEPWVPLDLFFDVESPESYEMCSLLNSFKRTPPVGKEKENQGVTGGEGQSTATGTDGSDLGTAMDGTASRPSSGYSDFDESDFDISNDEAHQDSGCRVPVPDQELIFREEANEYLNIICSWGIPVSSSPSGGGHDGRGRGGDGGEAGAGGVLGGVGGEGGDELGPLSLMTLAKLTIDEQVIRILKFRHVETYSVIKSLLARRLSDDELIRILKSVAVALFGNWVCKSSEVVHGFDIVCRDLILLTLRAKMMQNPIQGLQKQAIIDLVDIPGDRVKELLEQVAEYRRAEPFGWVLKKRPDTQFISDHPDTHKHAEEWWKMRQDQIVKEIKLRKQRKAQLAASGGAAKPPIDHTRLTRCVEHILLTEGGLSLTLLIPAVKKFDVSTIMGVNSDLLSSNANSHTSGVSEFSDMTETDLTDCLTPIAVEIGNLWVLRQIGNPHLDEYRSVLISLFRRYVKPLSKAEVLAAFKEQLRKPFDLPDFQFRKLIREFAKNVSGSWVFKGDS